MYQPVPLNWIAGDDISLRTWLPHFGHTSSGGSENFRIISNRWPHFSHSYSYNGITQSSSDRSVEQIAFLAEHQLAVQPEGRGALREQRVVKRAQGKRLALELLAVLAELQQHQL